MKTAPVKTLAELEDSGLIQLTRGKVISKEDMLACPGPFPVYSSAKENGGKFGEYGRYMFDEELITWSVDGGGRLFHRQKHKFSVTNVGGILRILNRNVIEYKFLYYILSLRHSEIKFDWVKKAHPSVIRKLYVGIPLPPLSEQQRIVRILDKAFDGISTVKANTEKNLHNARGLSVSVLNAAITGELTRGWRCAHPNIESASEKLKMRLIQRRSQWRGIGKYKEPDSPVIERIIDIPNSWVLSSPEQISTHIVDCPHSTPKWTKSGVLCLRTTNFKPGFLDLESVRFVSEETYKKRIMRLKPMPGDVLYSREGGILGIACIVPKNLKICLGQRMMHFRMDTDLVLPEYFAGVLNSALILSEVKRLTGGAASPHLNIRDIRKFPIPLPPITEQNHIVEKFNTISTETENLESIFLRKLATIDELKKSLLHQAFTGQL